MARKMGEKTFSERRKGDKFKVRLAAVDLVSSGSTAPILHPLCPAIQLWQAFLPAQEQTGLRSPKALSTRSAWWLCFGLYWNNL